MEVFMWKKYFRKKFKMFQASLTFNKVIFEKFFFKIENLIHITKVMLLFCKEIKMQIISFPKKHV